MAETYDEYCEENDGGHDAFVALAGGQQDQPKERMLTIANTLAGTTPEVPVMHINLMLLCASEGETHPHVLAGVVAVSAELEEVRVVDSGLVAVADHDVRLRDRLVGGHGLGITGQLTDR